MPSSDGIDDFTSPVFTLCVIVSGVILKRRCMFFSMERVIFGTTDDMIAESTILLFIPPSRKSALNMTKYSSLVFFVSV